MFLTVKTDDVTKGRKDLDPHGRFRGEWVKQISLIIKLLEEKGEIGRVWERSFSNSLIIHEENTKEINGFLEIR